MNFQSMANAILLDYEFSPELSHDMIRFPGTGFSHMGIDYGDPINNNIVKYIHIYLRKHEPSKVDLQFHALEGYF